LKVLKATAIVSQGAKTLILGNLFCFQERI